MKKCYINGLGSISAQNTADSIFLENAEPNVQENVLSVKIPVYKDFISPVALRRMSKCVKNGIVASALAMKDAQVEMVDAIITGIGIGCIEDSEKFLTAILENKEEYLTPISFIQSTHNTVATQIALGLQCKGYNFTYMNRSVSFASSLLDGKMMLEETYAETVLVGGVDETSDNSLRLFKLVGLIKNESEKPFNILESKTKGVVYGEGATFFVLQNQRLSTSYAEVLDVEFINSLTSDEVEEAMQKFLSANGLNSSDIDAVVLGYNGDVDYDGYYKAVGDSFFANTPQVYYKHLCGEYNTSSAFGLWVGAKILKNQQIPEVVNVNGLVKSAYKNILLYNQYQGVDHSFVLIANV